MVTVIVLNDGTTYTDIEGCTIVEVPDDYRDDHPVEDGKVITTFSEGNVRL